MPDSAVSASTVFDALSSRKSVRAFLPTPIDRDVVERILALASRAPNGSNIQPWKVWVGAGSAKDRLTAKIMAAHDADDPSHDEEYQYYPKRWTEPYLARRRKLGKDLYGVLGLGKDDKEGMKRQFGRNYVFFGAPVGLFVTINRQMEYGGWIDIGGFLHGITLAARGFGLHSCLQQAFAKYHRLIRTELAVPDDEYIVCGIALGHEDSAAPENRLVTVRDAVDQFATFHWE